MVRNLKTMGGIVSSIAVTLMCLGDVAAHAAPGLVEAVKNGDRAAIRSFVRDPREVNGAEPDGATALHWAAYLDDLETANLLISAGANVKAANRHGVTPLSLACINGAAAIIEALLKAGADPNTSLPGGETALMTAARTGNADGVKALLSHGAVVNAKESLRGQTALMWAAAEGNAAAVQALIEGGADVAIRANSGFTALLFAAREGKIDSVRTLLQAGADVNDTTQRPPLNGRPLFLSPDGPRAGGPSALVLAVASGHFELASLLLDAHADPNAAAQGWTALHQITWVRKPAPGGPPAPQGFDNLDSLELVKRLVDHGADVNARMTKSARGSTGSTVLNFIGATPFLMAARAKDADLMRLLAQLGANPSFTNADGTTALMAAAGVGTRTPGDDPGNEIEGMGAVKMALDLGGDVNAVDNNGETAMHGAAYKHFPSVVRLLAENGARIEIWNQKNKLGWTPLTIAEGVRRDNNVHFSIETADAIREAIRAAQ